MALPGRRNLRQAIYALGGNISEIARHFAVERQTVYNWLDHYQIRAEVKASRQQMRAVAGDVVYARLMSGDEDKAYEAARFVLTHLRDDGELLVLSPEVIRILGEQGIPLERVTAVLEQLVLSGAMGE